MKNTTDGLRDILSNLELPEGINILEPDFDEAERVSTWRDCDWRSYVPPTIRELWSELSEESRMVAVIMAEGEDFEEEWE